MRLFQRAFPPTLFLWKQGGGRARPWLREHGERTSRRVVELCLTAMLAIAIWQLVLTVKPFFMHGAHAATQPAAYQTSDPAPPSFDVAALVKAHLFGQPVGASNPPVVVNRTIRVRGIVFSPQVTEAIAILSFNDRDLLAHVGTLLPDGETVKAIQPDRLVLDQNGNSETLMLDIKRANLDAHFTPSQFASTEGAQGSSIATSPLSEQPASPAITPTRRPSAFMPHFESLQALRGPHAMRHFVKLHPPVPAAPPTRRPER